MYVETAMTNMDSYKLAHPSMFAPGMTKCTSNFTPRSMEYFNKDVPSFYKVDGIVFFGLQAFLQRFNYVWQTTFFDVPIEEIVEEAIRFNAPFCGPNGVRTDHIVALHKLGYLPLRIKALPEGAFVPVKVPVLIVENTHPDFAWLPNNIETWISTELWKASTSATRAMIYRMIAENAAEVSGANKAFIPFQNHDFSVRGMSGITDAAFSGAGALLFSLGTDNLPAVKLIQDCYNGKETFIGASVPASEHSVACSYGQESEIDYFSRQLDQYPSGIVSLVSDTWDFFGVVGGPDSIAGKLKDKILARIPDALGFAKVVFRPDSGDPETIICGYKIIDERDFYSKSVYDVWDEGYEVVRTGSGKYFHLCAVYGRYDGSLAELLFGDEINKYEAIGAIRCLDEIFGSTTNELGYKTLNQRVGLIYGDSITIKRELDILSKLESMGYASDNCVFGIGSYTFNFVTRDTCGFAMKATNIVRNDVSTPIFKNPKTDSGTKKSARGLLRVDSVNGRYVLRDNVSEEEAEGDEMKVVFENSKILVNESYSTIRERALSIIL